MRASDVKLPEGVELAADPNMIMAIVAASPSAELLEGEAAEGEAEAAEGGPEVAPTPEPADA